MITTDQIKLIHTAKRALNLTDENYKDILAGFGAESCKNLSLENYRRVMAIFEQMGFKAELKSKINHRRPRNEMASGDQIGKIKGLWKTSEVVRDKSDSALNHFIKRIAGVDHIDWLPERDVHKVIKAIECLNR